MISLFKAKQRNTLPQLVNALQKRLTIATQFLERISEGRFDFEISETQHDDKNEHDFYKTLNSVSRRLSDYALKEKQRTWISEGTTRFMVLIGGDNRLKQDFYDHVLKFLVTYTSANQGGIFLLNDQDEHNQFLELCACYAFGKKKFLEKRIAIGEGIAGQCYLEKKTTVLKQVPESYTKITSGLGEATPRFLLVIPMKYNEEVQGIIELAYFEVLEQYKIDFLETIAENIASVTMNLRHSRRAELLFQESQETAKMLQEQEETLRQNVEELVATQEEMKRHQAEVDKQSALMKFIVDNTPTPLFVKDDKGRYVIVNRAEAQLFNLHDREIIGKEDSAFVKDEQELDMIRKSDEAVLNSDEAIELPLQHFTTGSGKRFVFKTTKIPFINPVTGRKNILGISVDLTEKLTLQKKLSNERRVSDNIIIINLAGRQRMLSQKIAFYCEALIRGKKQYVSILNEAIELYEHSLQVLRYGGLPMNITCDHPLPELHRDLAPIMERISNTWASYKKAAENILYFSFVEPNDNRKTLSTELDHSISTIEDLAEPLLELNDNLMRQYIQLHAEVVQG